MEGLRGWRTQADRLPSAWTKLQMLERLSADAPVSHGALLSARPQGRPDADPLPRFARSAEPGRARAGPDAALRLSRSPRTPTSLLLSWASTSRAARPMRPPRPKDLSRTRRSGTPRSQPHSSAPPAPWRRGSFPANPGREVSVLLSHGPQARRAGELVHRSFCRSPAHDARARA